MIKKLTLLIFCSSLAFSGGEINKEISDIFMDNHFLYISGGYSKNKIDYKLNQNDDFKVGALDDSGYLFEVGVGYRFNKNLFSTIFYQREVLDIVSKNNALLSLNYQLSEVFLSPYIGVIAGYSNLQWDSEPYDIQRNNKFNSDSFAYGFQIGAEYPINEHIGLFSKYEFLSTDHEMNILYDRNIIDHKNSQNLQIGFRYEF